MESSPIIYNISCRVFVHVRRPLLVVYCNTTVCSSSSTAVVNLTLLYYYINIMSQSFRYSHPPTCFYMQARLSVARNQKNTERALLMIGYEYNPNLIGTGQDPPENFDLCTNLTEMISMPPERISLFLTVIKPQV